MVLESGWVLEDENEFLVVTVLDGDLGGVEVLLWLDDDLLLVSHGVMVTSNGGGGLFDLDGDREMVSSSSFVVSGFDVVWLSLGEVLPFRDSLFIITGFEVIFERTPMIDIKNL